MISRKLGENRSSYNKCCIQITCPNSGTTNMIQHLQMKHLGPYKLYSDKKNLSRKSKKSRKESPIKFSIIQKSGDFHVFSQLKINIFRSSEAWEKISEFLAILKPFQEATVISSGEKCTFVNNMPLHVLEKNPEQLKKRKTNNENFGSFLPKLTKKNARAFSKKL